MLITADAAIIGFSTGAILLDQLWRWSRRFERKLIETQREQLNQEHSFLRQACDTLTNLRANCFIPDERGVKVRYYQASPARQAKAESVKEV